MHDCDDQFVCPNCLSRLGADVCFALDSINAYDVLT